MTEGEEALFEDLAAVGDEEQPGAWEGSSEVSVVDGRHHGLAGAGGCDQQVPMVAVGASDVDAFQHPLLEGPQ